MVSEAVWNAIVAEGKYSVSIGVASRYRITGGLGSFKERNQELPE